MIIETDNYDFNPEYIAAVDRDYLSDAQTPECYVHFCGAGVCLSGEAARSFLYQWDKYKAQSKAKEVVP